LFFHFDLQIYWMRSKLDLAVKTRRPAILHSNTLRLILKHDGRPRPRRRRSRTRCAARASAHLDHDVGGLPSSQASPAPQDAVHWAPAASCDDQPRSVCWRAPALWLLKSRPQVFHRPHGHYHHRPRQTTYSSASDTKIRTVQGRWLRGCRATRC
jgi:hypothetical protein